MVSSGLPELSEQLDTDKVYNKSQGKPVRKGFWSLVYHNSIYRNVLRPLMPVEFRMKLAKLLLPKAPDRPDPPSDETRAWLRSELADDAARLNTILARETPLWQKSADMSESFAHQASGN